MRARARVRARYLVAIVGVVDFEAREQRVGGHLVRLRFGFRFGLGLGLGFGFGSRLGSGVGVGVGARVND